MKALVSAFNQEKALVGAFSVIVQPVVEPIDRFTALVKWYFLGDTNQLWGEYLPVSVTFSGAHTTMINIGQHYLQNLDNEHIYTISIDWWQCQYVYLLYIRGPPRGLVSRLRHAYCMLAVWRYCGILMFSSDHVLVNLSRPPSAYLYCSILLHAALHKSLKRRLKTKVREDFTITEKAPTQIDI